MARNCAGFVQSPCAGAHFPATFRNGDGSTTDGGVTRTNRQLGYLVYFGILAGLLACGDPDAGANRGERPDSGATTDGATAHGDAGGDGAVAQRVSCAEVTCDDHASCSDSAADAVCSCGAGWAGDGKSCTDVDECKSASDNDCANSATCDNTAGGYLCACKAGYAGNGKSCDDVDECATGAKVCSANASCDNTAGSASCTCNDGYAGPTCGDLDECVSGAKTCTANADCKNTPGSAYCGCQAGYHDTDGDTNNELATCAANIACSTGCGANATCRTDVQSAGGDTCVCNDGYSGDGALCAPVNECAANTDDCSPQAKCEDLVVAPFWSCTCEPGFTGDGKTCTDKDECALDTDNCNGLATCVNTPGSYTCQCPEGYQPDGMGGCANVNECAVPGTCAESADCTDETPGFSCACPSGYDGDGYTSCVDIDECADSTLNTCNGGEQCVNNGGGYTCGCDAPYTQDGADCYCDLTGFWAMRQDVTTTWADVPLGTSTLIQAGSYRTTVWELHRYRYDGEKVVVDKKGCGSAGTPDLVSPLFGETYGNYVPNSVWDAFALLKGGDVTISKALPGMAFDSPHEAAVLGVKLADPMTSAWPASRSAIDLADRTDPDGDGVDGLTSWSRLPSQMTHASTTGDPKHYSYIPISLALTGWRRSACVSSALRVVNYLDGAIETCDRITGSVVNVKTEGRVFDCRRAASDSTDHSCTQSDWASLVACNDAEIDTLDGQSAAQDSTATFELVKITSDADSTSVSCQTVKQSLPAL